jgi:hypothetical protein
MQNNIRPSVTMKNIAVDGTALSKNNKHPRIIVSAPVKTRDKDRTPELNISVRF